MKILIAPDKFKGSITAKGVCDALSKGLKKVHPNATIVAKPLADGGDGSLTILAQYLELEKCTLSVQDPLGRMIEASYLLDNKSAYIELSAASGLALLHQAERNCMFTSTFGTGELMLDAIKKGITEIYLFIGGSATNDGGIGIANALGYQFYDKEGRNLKPIGKNLIRITHIDNNKLKFDLDKLEVKVICDVNNPFYGENGAAHIYAAQKGAKPSEIILLDQGLSRLATQLKIQAYPDITAIPGAGAAGGVGGGAIVFLNATLESGIHTFLEITQLEKAIKDCDLIITGEGSIDAQTEEGKVISGVCSLAKKHHKLIIAVAGSATFPITSNLNLSKVYTVISKSKSLEDAMKNTATKLVDIGVEIGHDLDDIFH